VSGLRRWQKSLLLSEVIAAAIILYGYRALASAESAGNFWQRFASGVAGIALLSPGLWLLRPGPEQSLFPACLLAFAIYTVVLFGLLSLLGMVLKKVRAMSRRVEIGPHDVARYMR